MVVMITAPYVAWSWQKLDLELKIIRKLLLSSENAAARNAFVAEEARDFADGMDAFLERKPDRDQLDDLLAPVTVKQYSAALKRELPHLVEFSESRLNQMELILRYAVFESLLSKAVGNILWQYPDLLRRKVNQDLLGRRGVAKEVTRENRRLAHNALGGRIAETRRW